MVAKESKDEIIDNHSTDLEKEPKRGKEEESDSEPRRDSVSSQGDSQTADDEKVERVSRVPKKIVKKDPSNNHSHGSRVRADQEAHKSQSKILHNTPKKSTKPKKGPSKVTAKNTPNTISKNMKVPPKPSSESSEGIDDKPIEELKEVDLVDGALNGAQSVGSDDETVDAEEIGEHEGKAALDQRNEHENKAALDQMNEHENKAALDQRNGHEDKAALDQRNGHEDKAALDQRNGHEDKAALDQRNEHEDKAHLDQRNGHEEKAALDQRNDHEDKTALDQRIEEMEMRIEKLEEELREVAALEISLYSVVPEHGSSAHKVHTPARRLSRLYIHASKHWTQNKRATIAKNTASGLVLIAKSCGNDVPRLTFWLSNTIVLREIISQAFGNSIHSSLVVRFSESNGSVKRSDGKSSTLKWKGSSGGKQVNKPGFLQFVDDWQETRTFTSALEKVESWIFSRIVESVWWQTLTPHMQPPVNDSYTNKTIERLLGPALGDQQQGSFSINLWKNAFQDAFQRLCPVRAGGHECGCLPVIARMVMEQCVARLDVAMFNAILRESAYEIPTDPISDPIVDSRVLPIPAGDLSFGSGAQLKNSVGTWSRWLTDLFGMDADDSMTEVQINGEDGEIQGGNDEPKSFHLLNALSDLLMLPKDMLMDRSIRKEVCPSISLPLLKRILCNFTPDEFCPDPVPGAVLEAVNAESIVEWRLSGESASSFPYPATPVLYAPPSSADVAEKVAEAGGKSQLARNASMVQKKGYTSDEELEELDSPLTSIIEKMPPSPSVARNGNGKHSEATEEHNNGLNARYELLREVWSS